jgi:3-dehydroquinate dehydratase I
LSDDTQAVDGSCLAELQFAMPQIISLTAIEKPQVVGSLNGVVELASTTLAVASESCDLVEIRLDLLRTSEAIIESETWSHLSNIPLLFAARRFDEGGGQPLSARDRAQMLEQILSHASMIDLEVASIAEMAPLIAQIRAQKIPWVASFHDFEKLPNARTLDEAVEAAKSAGAAVFKLAAMLNCPSDMARLAEFQLANHGIPVATMGMGILAPVSRLLCAQCGSLLNYGYLGTTPTAPGQWHSRALKDTISQLEPFKKISV